MPEAKNTWAVILRCDFCRGRFIIRRATVDQFSILQSAHTCPYCGTRPYEGRAHALADIIPDALPVYRKTAVGDTWHFEQSCVQWPIDRYLELDGAPRIGEICGECRARMTKRH